MKQLERDSIPLFRKRRQIAAIAIALSMIFTMCARERPVTEEKNEDETADAASVKRFFGDDSFWNQPIDENPEVDPNSTKWIHMLEQEPTGENFSPVFSKWTIPVY